MYQQAAKAFARIALTTTTTAGYRPPQPITKESIQSNQH
jgi:hypothetical protein